LICLSGGVEAAPFELRNTTTANAWIERAVAVVNAAVRDPNLPLYFFNTTQSEADAERIPVYHVSPVVREGVVAEVPSDCRCIIINGALFERSFAHLARDNELMKGKEVPMLTFLLLHELGHIAKGHYGQFVNDNKGRFLPDTISARPNNDETASKLEEQEADDYVAFILKREFERLGTGNPPIDDYDLFFAGTDTNLFLGSLSLTVAANTALNCFGCRLLGDPRVFWDHGRFHPNFEYRLLRMNHAIAATPESRELLESYEKQRAEIGDRGPTILYVDPNFVPRSAEPAKRADDPRLE
jgi:hypothetical protein